ncbi:MAG: phosphatase PAP2 family protein [Myxococcales bacterium]|nr:phosphatase PAP2 family protein [Myxococcales bacterium]
MESFLARAGRMARLLRPAEWVVLLFWASMAVAIVRHGLSLSDGELRRLDLLAALMAVVLLRAVVRYRGLRWPAESQFARVHWAWLPLALAPLALDVWAVLHLPPAAEDVGSGGLLASALLTLWWLWRRFALAGLPLALLWLALGVHIKRHGGLNARRFLADTGRSVLSAGRDWLPPMALILSYGLLGTVLGKMGVADQDELLARLDRLLFFGRDPVLELEAIVSRPLSEWLTFCYAFYAPIFPLCFAVLYAKPSPGPFRELSFALCLTLAIGYVGYTLVPAIGPVFTQEFSVSLEGYYSGWMREKLLDRFRVPRDCFPSLHTAVSLVFLWACWRHARRLFWALLPFVGLIPFACVYLRYHYVVDVLAGALLAILTCSAAGRWTGAERVTLDARPSTLD